MLSAEAKCLQYALTLQTGYLSNGEVVKAMASHINDMPLQWESKQNQTSTPSKYTSSGKSRKRIVGLIIRSFLHLSPEMFRTLYITFVRLHLECAETVCVKTVFIRGSSFPKTFKQATGDLVEIHKHLHFCKKSAAADQFFPICFDLQTWSKTKKQPITEVDFKVQSRSFYF